MRMRVLPTVLIALLAHAAGAWSGATAPRPAPPALISRLQRIESAFRQGDATALRLSFSATGKLWVDLKDLTEGQELYGAGQLQVIFGQIFEEFRTRDFSFPREEVRVSSPGAAFARGRWVRASRRERLELAETLTFTLREDGSDWRILEIRSSR